MSVIQHILTTFPSQLSKRTDFSRSIISAKVVGMWPDLEVSRIPTFLPGPGIPGKPSCSLPEVPRWTVDLGFGDSWPSCSVKTDSGLVSQALGHSPALPLHIEGLLLGHLPRGSLLPEQNSRWVLYLFLILWPPDAKSPLFGKRPWGLERLKAGEEGTTEDEMVGRHCWLNGHEIEQAPGDGEGQGSLVCCSPWGHKELDTTEWLNNDKHQLTCYKREVCRSFLLCLSRKYQIYL